MLRRVRGLTTRLYEQLLEREVSGVPTHVAVIQDGNRRYARERGAEKTDGHRAGADTTERILEWCADLGIEELTLYAFSTENFDRPADEREAIFDLITEKLRNLPTGLKSTTGRSGSARSVRPNGSPTGSGRRSPTPRAGPPTTMGST